MQVKYQILNLRFTLRWDDSINIDLKYWIGARLLE
jgi:hypothetical protein